MEGIQENANFGSSVAPKSLFRIGEVSRLTSTKPFVLRYWETEFPMLQPAKSPKGHRLYRREDIDTVFTIKHLLYDEGFTIAGARRHLRDKALGSNGAVAIPDDAADEIGEVAATNGDSVEANTASPPLPSGMSDQLALLNRKTLLELRDSLRSLLTALERE